MKKIILILLLLPVAIVLWGGVIEKVLHEPGETKLIVSRVPLNSEGYPQTEATDREFVAHTHQSLDPRIFHVGTIPLGAILLAQTPFPDDCQYCPWDGNLGQRVRIIYDSPTNQYFWEYTCYRNHIWRCPAEPPAS